MAPFLLIWSSIYRSFNYSFLFSNLSRGNPRIDENVYLLDQDSKRVIIIVVFKKIRLNNLSFGKKIFVLIFSIFENTFLVEAVINIQVTILIAAIAAFII